jgi:Ni/Fe-hydrogenase subunit HybB-like protein
VSSILCEHFFAICKKQYSAYVSFSSYAYASMAFRLFLVMNTKDNRDPRCLLTAIIFHAILMLTYMVIVGDVLHIVAIFA